MTDIVVQNGSPSVLLEKARQALERAATVDEVKNIRDKAEALRLYSRQAGFGLEMQNRCAEIKLRAERKAGELLGGVVHVGRPFPNSITLTDLGVSTVQSSRWQRIAKVPEVRFERFIADALEHHKEITTTAALKLSKSNDVGEVPKRKRRHLGEVARDAGWNLRRDIERLQRIVGDDRFVANKEQVAAHLRGHLSHAIEVCQDLLIALEGEQ